ncbi:MAG: hypothetical protein QXQ40_01700 [Candidatus Aenigmatarchaeota archaeon]
MRALTKIKPIHLMHTPEISQDEKDLAIETIEDVLEIAGIKLRIEDLGVWRDKNYKNPDNTFAKHKSVDWYIDQWFDPERKQVNARKGIEQLFNAFWIQEEQCYNVILTARDLYAPGTNFVVGCAQSGIGAIISVRRFRHIPKEREVKKQEIYHEIGHMFGMPDRMRSCCIEESLGPHCTNVCAMRQGIYVPHDWIIFAEDRKRTGQIYCSACVSDMKKYFEE